jgi:hypothetical protein
MSDFEEMRNALVRALTECLEESEFLEEIQQLLSDELL